MLHAMGFFGVLLVGGLIFGAVAVVVGLLKLAFKLLLLPLHLAAFTLKGVLALAGGLLALLVVGPVVLVVGLVLLLPLLLLGGVIWGAVSVFSHA